MACTGLDLQRLGLVLWPAVAVEVRRRFRVAKTVFRVFGVSTGFRPFEFVSPFRRRFAVSNSFRHFVGVLSAFGPATVQACHLPLATCQAKAAVLKSLY